MVPQSGFGREEGFLARARRAPAGFARSASDFSLAKGVPNFGFRANRCSSGFPQGQGFQRHEVREGRETQSGL
ncbi:hypothetical protein [Tardisphaera saccharovorans]